MKDGILQALRTRRSFYQLNKESVLTEDELIRYVEDIVRLVPDAYDMKSQRVVLALGEQHDRLWDAIYNVFSGKVAREKIDSFKAGVGTVLFFYDQETIERMQWDIPGGADNFPLWALQSNGMLQMTMWTALCEQGYGASLQHYNPVIDARVRELFDVPENYVLLAQLVFGGIEAHPEPKAEEDISARVKIAR